MNDDRGQYRHAWRWLSAYGPTAIVLAATLVLAGRLFRLISRYSVNILFSDQWDFKNATLFGKHSLWEMFAWQHGPHRQGLGALFEKLVEPLFSWNSRIEAFVIGGVIVVGVLCALVLKKRLYGSFSVADATIPAIFLTPGQYISIFGVANFAHGSFPMLLVVLYCLAWTVEKYPFRIALVLILNFVTIYTGFGFFLGIVTPALLVLDRYSSALGKRPSRWIFLLELVVALASLASFFVGYTFVSAIDCFSPRPKSPLVYAKFVAIMFGNFFSFRDTGLLSRVVGSVTLAALLTVLAVAVWKVLRRGIILPPPRRKTMIVTTVLVAYCLLFCVDTAYGRVCAGLVIATASRYVIYVELGIFGLYLFLLSLQQRWARNCLVGVLLVFTFVGPVRIDREGMSFYRDGKQRWKSCYFRIESVKQCDAITGFTLYGARPEQGRVQEKMRFLKKEHLNLYSDSKLQ